MNDPTPPQSIRLVVPGVAQPAGSKRALPLGGKFGGRPIIVDANPKARQWKETVASAALAARVQMLEGPLRLEVRFVMPRPQGHFGSGKNAGRLRSSAPCWPTVRPDSSKLIRGVEDALTGIVWRDDSQVVQQLAEKVYGEPARVEITIRQLVAAEAAASMPKAHAEPALFRELAG